MNKKHLAVGSGVVFLLFALTWAASSLFFAGILWLWFSGLGIFILYLLKRNTRPARIGAAVLQWNTLFLLFLPKHIRSGLQELKQRENTKT